MVISGDSAIRFFTDEDADPDALAGERVAVVGYGNLGRTVALNLRDSGVSLVVGNIEDAYAEQARDEGFTVLPPGEAVASSDIALILLPDEIIPEAFKDDLAPSLPSGSAIVFASGYNLAYGLIEPPAGIDVLLLAPRMAGENARQRYLNRDGFYAYISVEQEASGRAWKRLLGLAHAAGVLWAGALELDARREADIDLFIEQTVGAVIGVAIMNAFEIGVEAGLPPETMVLEMYMSGEMELVWRGFREQGFFRSATVHGPTAQFGGMIWTMQLMGTEIGAKFRQALEEIQSGEFARQFQADREAGYPTLSIAQAMIEEDSPIAQAEAQVREMLGRGT